MERFALRLRAFCPADATTAVDPAYDSEVRTPQRPSHVPARVLIPVRERVFFTVRWKPLPGVMR
jgi:hypothetical protein